MTGYTVHTGTSKKFVQGWDRIFSEPQKKVADKSGSASGKQQAKAKAGKGSRNTKRAGK